MRPIRLLLIALLLHGCKSHKEVAHQQEATLDSIALSEHHRSSASMDSMSRCVDFTFDTLEITVERPSTIAGEQEVIRLKAVKGRKKERQRAHRKQLDVYNRLDTVRYHNSAAESSQEHTATTRAYNPPNGTALLVVAILVIASGMFFYFRRK